MKIAALAFGLFGAALLVHWIIWRIRMPRRQTLTLLVIFLAAWPIGIAVIYAMAPDALEQQGPWGWLHISCFHLALSVGYVVGYSGLEERSPSMTLVEYVASAQGQSGTRDELLDLLRTMRPVEKRVDGLLRDRMIVENEGIYRLTAKGWAWASTLSAWRRLLGIPLGG